MPYRFVPCMCAGLAYYLAIKNAPQRVQELKLLYEDELQRALAEDGSASSTYITPKVYYRNIMSKYATGKYAKAISDRSGTRISIQRNGQRMEWFVCSCFRIRTKATTIRTKTTKSADPLH